MGFGELVGVCRTSRYVIELSEDERAELLDRPTQGVDAQRLRLPEALAVWLLSFGEHYRQIARPFEWTFSHQDLDALLADRPPRTAARARRVTV